MVWRKLPLLLGLLCFSCGGSGLESEGQRAADCHAAVVFSGQTYAGFYHYYCQNAYKALGWAGQQCSRTTSIFVSGGSQRNEGVLFDYVLTEPQNQSEASKMGSSNAHVMHMYKAVSKGLLLAKDLGAHYVLRIRLDLRLDHFTSSYGFLNKSEVFGVINPLAGNLPSDNVMWGSIEAVTTIFAVTTMGLGSPEGVNAGRIRAAGLHFVQAPISVYLIKPAGPHNEQRSSGVRHWFKAAGMTEAAHEHVLLKDVPLSFSEAVPSSICPVSPTVAVCIAGELRTFLNSAVQQRLATHFHKPGYTYFLSSSTNLSSPVDMSSMLRVPLQTSFIDNGSPVRVSNEEFACKTHYALDKFACFLWLSAGPHATLRFFGMKSMLKCSLTGSHVSEPTSFTWWTYHPLMSYSETIPLAPTSCSMTTTCLSGLAAWLRQCLLRRNKFTGTARLLRCG
jgi:hypothetical protein